MSLVKVEKVLITKYIENSFGHEVTLLMTDGSVHVGWGLTSDMVMQEIWDYNYTVYSYSSISDYFHNH